MRDRAWNQEPSIVQFLRVISAVAAVLKRDDNAREECHHGPLIFITWTQIRRKYNGEILEIDWTSTRLSRL